MRKPVGSASFRPVRARLHVGRIVCAGALLLVFAAGADEGFEPIFDGRSLAGWSTPDRSYWTVEDGAITGRITREHPCETNQYLVWMGGELADFELKLKSRLNGQGGINNGFQFRSRLLPDHDICGYQVDNNLQTPWLVRLYDEYGRHTLALRGESTRFEAGGARATRPIPEASGPAWFRLEDWHEYHLVCVGPKITLHVDGRLAAEVEDHDRRRQELQGIFALQLHSGPPTVVQFKDIRLKILRPASLEAAPTASRLDTRRSKLRDQAWAWWPLDAGGHGARPPLRHVPAWDRFELNVRGDGPGARAGAKVVLLDGAYFDAGPVALPEGDALTIWLRARDPEGAWNGALFGSYAEGRVPQFSLAGEDTAGTNGPEIELRARTEQGFAQVRFPLDEARARAWLDLAGRWDGRTLTLFCDGHPQASAPLRGSLNTSSGRLLIAAGLVDGKVERHFKGELEAAALWPRALTDREIRALSRGR